jgi:membrane associated rhomboid family serine protease
VAIPLYDIQKRRTFPVVNVALIVVNVLAFLYELSLGAHLQGFIQQAAFVPARFVEAGNPFTETRSVLVSMFLHGGWGHLLGNMLYMWIFADNVEDRFGHGRFLVFYLACGWIATLAHGLSAPNSTIPSIGASGAISGVLGAYLVMFPRARVITLIPLGFFIRVAELPALIVLGFWFVLQLVSGVGSLTARSAQAGVAWWAHIGGFVAGIAVGLAYLALRRRRA